MINIRQLAMLAKVSTATVSRATNPRFSHMVSPKTRERIFTLIRKHGYTPNAAAKNLSQPKTRTIGVILPYVENVFYSSYYTKILSGVADSLSNTDYNFKLILLREEHNWDNYNFYIGEGVEGVVLTQWFRFFSEKGALNAMDIPIVAINDYEEGLNLRFICEDGCLGGRLLAQHFYELGHRNVGVVTGPDWSRDSHARFKSFEEFCRCREMHLSVARGHFDFVESTRAALDALLKDKVTAIFCCNDNMAYMACDYFKENNIVCPRDISLVGYDDDFRSALCDPPLTTINVPVEDMARQAVRDLLNCLSGVTSRDDFAGFVRAPVTLIVRGSTKKIT